MSWCARLISSSASYRRIPSSCQLPRRSRAFLLLTCLAPLYIRRLTERSQLEARRHGLLTASMPLMQPSYPFPSVMEPPQGKGATYVKLPQWNA
jgi:hypothetical protein